jgi:hypothetical protein
VPAAPAAGVVPGGDVGEPLPDVPPVGDVGEPVPDEPVVGEDGEPLPDEPVVGEVGELLPDESAVGTAQTAPPGGAPEVVVLLTVSATAVGASPVMSVPTAMAIAADRCDAAIGIYLLTLRG